MHSEECPSVETEGNRRGFLRSTAGVAGLVLGGASMAHARSPRAQNHHPRPTQPPGQGNGIHNRLPELYPSWNKINFGQIRTDENAHVSFLVAALGAAARPKPNFQNLEQPDVFSFAKTSFVLENTGVGAYLGAAPAILDKGYLAAAGSILTIEARHSGYLGTLLDATPDLFMHSFDNPDSFQNLLNNAAPFIVDLNGGPPIAFDMNHPSDANDIAILNVALALEYLERDFYNINVAKFFP